MTEEDDEINLQQWQKVVIVGIISLLIGLTFGISYSFNIKYRTPPELAEYIEELIFNNTNIEDLNHPFLKYFVQTSNIVTIDEIKSYYKVYYPSSRALLEGQLNELCYKGEWKHEDN